MAFPFYFVITPGTPVWGHQQRRIINIRFVQEQQRSDQKNIMLRCLGLHPGSRFPINGFSQRIVALVEFIACVKEFR